MLPSGNVNTPAPTPLAVKGKGALVIEVKGKTYLNLKATLEKLKLSKTSLYKEIKSGQIPKARLYANESWWTAEDLENYQAKILEGA